ncbi:MAG: hypothetical protein P8Q36_15910 [Alphaproteobacteria bacterium]|nr:hypothetical protein [Alphaproteobacteria bacterium]
MVMLTSKELIEQAGISRATLNNYIALGLLPKPEVMAPEGGDSKARRIGYFPDEAVTVLERVRVLKDGERPWIRLLKNWSANAKRRRRLSRASR